MAETMLFINGEWVAAQSGETFATYAPSTGEKIADVAKAGREDAVKAVQAARTAFDEGPWPKMSGRQCRPPSARTTAACGATSRRKSAARFCSASPWGSSSARTRSRPPRCKTAAARSAKA